jgi:hypothetical protein
MENLLRRGTRETDAPPLIIIRIASQLLTPAKHKSPPQSTPPDVAQNAPSPIPTPNNGFSRGHMYPATTDGIAACSPHARKRREVGEFPAPPPRILPLYTREEEGAWIPHASPHSSNRTPLLLRHDDRKRVYFQVCSRLRFPTLPAITNSSNTGTWIRRPRPIRPEPSSTRRQHAPSQLQIVTP